MAFPDFTVPAFPRPSLYEEREEPPGTRKHSFISSFKAAKNAAPAAWVSERSPPAPQVQEWEEQSAGPVFATYNLNQLVPTFYAAKKQKIVPTIVREGLTRRPLAASGSDHRSSFFSQGRREVGNLTIFCSPFLFVSTLYQSTTIIFFTKHI